jgi:NADH-quinone oxidoreductase subunit J
MNVVFYVGSVIAVVSTFLVITGRNAVHALLSLVVSLFGVALVFATLGAPFVAALEVIVYAGAVMVLFVFVVMLLNVSPLVIEQESTWLTAGIWVAPLILGAVLLGSLAATLLGQSTPLAGIVVGPVTVGTDLFGPYLIGVELASLLLLAGVVGAYHLGRREVFGVVHPSRVAPSEERAGELVPEATGESALAGSMSRAPSLLGDASGQSGGQPC